MDSKRTKLPNWTNNQKEMFIYLIQCKKDVLFLPNSNRACMDLKYNTWIEIHNELKKSFGGIFADIDIKKIKIMWSRMKDKAIREMDNYTNKEIETITSQSYEICKLLNMNVEGVKVKTDLLHENDALNYSSVSKRQKKRKTTFVPIEVKRELLESSMNPNDFLETNLEKEPVIYTAPNQSGSEHISSIEMCENLDSVNCTDKDNASNVNDEIHALEIEILMKKKSAVKAIWETAEINKMIAVQKLKQLVQGTRGEREESM